MADETTKVNLQNDITINGVTFKAGHNVEVPKNQAEDVTRIDYDREKVKSQMMTKQIYEIDAGEFAVGDGAQ